MGRDHLYRREEERKRVEGRNERGPREGRARPEESNKIGREGATRYDREESRERVELQLGHKKQIE